MSRKPAKLATTTRVAPFTTTEPFGAAIATGVDAETAHALAHSFACVAVELDDRLPEGMLGRLKSVALTPDAEALSLPEIEADVIEALTELAVQQGHIKQPPETAVDGDQASAVSDDSIKIGTISTELAVRLREALDVPYVQTVRLDVGEARSMSKPIPVPLGTVMTASSVRTTVTLTIEASTGVLIAQAAE